MSVTPAAPAEQRWPGERLGLPELGPRSIGRIGRRALALVIDWGLAVLISVAFFNYDPWANLLIFAIAQILFLTLLGGSIGHLIMGLRVVPLEGGWVGWWRPWVRTLLLCLVIPAVIWDRDQRGLHDRAAGTVLVRK
ncbi:MAG TPA: RDD family protein [Terrimesophilobacter sp.]|nr:RDD family protein [Terrimesophilobacter sp.]